MVIPHGFPLVRFKRQGRTEIVEDAPPGQEALPATVTTEHRDTESPDPAVRAAKKWGTGGLSET